MAPGTVGAYLKLRRRTFKDDPAHPDDAYWAFAKESDAELAAHPALRGLLEYHSRPKSQAVFYRWVRKAYVDWVYREHLDPGIAEDIPGVILRADARASRLRELVRREGIAAYPATWAAMGLSIQGFNPRPEKGGGRFILGTLSQHAFGAAVDIDPDHNPQLSMGQWRWIEKVAGRHVDRRPERWRDTPKDLWQDIKDLNDDFVKGIARRIGEEEARRRVATGISWFLRIVGLPEGSHHPATSGRRRPVLPAVDVVFADHPELKQYRGGFFRLGWELVERLHDQKLFWGAAFKPPSRVDLHHFELPSAMATIEAEEAFRARLARALRLRLIEPETLRPRSKPPIHVIDPLRLDPSVLPPEVPK